MAAVSELHRNYRQQIDGRHPPFYGCFFQVGHQQNSPVSPEPAFKVLRTIPNEEVFAKAVAYMGRRMDGQGNVLFALYGEPILIAKSEKDQLNPEYVARRTKEILDEHYAERIDANERFDKLSELKHNKHHEEAREIEAEVVRKHNEKGWVKYMKKHAHIPETVPLNPGARCELPIADTSSNDFDERASEAPTSTDCAPADGSQTYVAVTTMVSSDDTMETVVYVHATIPKGANLEEFVYPIGTLVTPMIVDVVDVGEWTYPVSNLWTQEPDDQSWADQKVNDMQRKRYRDAKAADAKTEELRESERQRCAALRTLAQRVGITFEETVKICQTYQATAELVATTKVNDPVCREEAVEMCKAKYLNAPPPPCGIEQPQ